MLLYTVRKRFWSWGDEEIVAQTLATGARKRAADGCRRRAVSCQPATWCSCGEAILFAVPFDAERLEVRGPAVAVLDSVAQALTAGHAANMTGAGQFAIAATGDAGMDSRGPVAPYRDRRLVTVDRRGQVAHLPGAGAQLRPATCASRPTADDSR